MIGKAARAAMGAASIEGAGRGRENTSRASWSRGGWPRRVGMNVPTLGSWFAARARAKRKLRCRERLRAIPRAALSPARRRPQPRRACGAWPTPRPRQRTWTKPSTTVAGEGTESAVGTGDHAPLVAHHLGIEADAVHHAPGHDRIRGIPPRGAPDSWWSRRSRPGSGSWARAAGCFLNAFHSCWWRGLAHVDHAGSGS